MRDIGSFLTFKQQMPARMGVSAADTCERVLRRATWVVVLVATAAICGVTRAQEASSDSSPAAERPPLSVGFYAGELYENDYLYILDQPWNIDLSSTYLAALNVGYRLYTWQSLPLELSGEVDFDKHFGQAHEYEGVVTPIVRWTWFPWNRYLYTNVRVAALGISYVTGVSAWERDTSGNNRGSNVLQFGAVELAFSRSASARGEFFIRVHHRSGIFGLINGVNGGSNYLSVGFRTFL